MYQPISGDVDFSVRVTGIENVDQWSKAGVMIRAGLAANAAHATMFASSAKGTAFQRRATAGGTSVHTAGGSETAPVWVRIVRKGNLFTAYRSTNGTAWTQVGTHTITMPSTVYVGLAVTSHQQWSAAAATFTNVSTAQGGLPAPWSNTDVGSPAIKGSALLSGGTFTVRGSGTDIFSTADQFQYVYQAWQGDGEIVARVASLSGGGAFAKAGVMVREKLTASSKNVLAGATLSRGWTFQARLADGASTVTNDPKPAGAAPGWVRIVREGNLFSGYFSADGGTWTLLGSENVPMATTVYVGLIVGSVDASAVSTGTFTNVVARKLTDTNQAPSVAITSPTSGASFTAPATISMTASASDTDGSISKVEFYRGSTLMATDTSSPYSYTWSNAPAGTYSFTAVATDNGGERSTSTAVSVTVTSTAPAPKPTTLVFNASSDHTSNVTSYSVALRRATDSTSATPVATRNLGKPTPSGGEISVDISTLVDPLPAGSYYAIVTATGAGGSTPSAKSANFTK